MKKISRFDRDKLVYDTGENRVSGKSMTGHQDFDMNGYIFVENLYDISNIIEPPPSERGIIKFDKTTNQYAHLPEEEQVSGCLARYNLPMYKDVYFEVKKRLENIIGKKLQPTYFYDRFYFEGQHLQYHLDREACEISVTMHISSNTTECWPLGIKTPEFLTPDRKEVVIPSRFEYICMNPGDAVVYKGIERPHWRNPLPSRHKKVKRLLNRLIRKEDDTYYHQIFFHYVLADGCYSHYAFDSQLNNKDYRR